MRGSIKFLVIGLVFLLVATVSSAEEVKQNITISRADVFYKYLVVAIEIKRIGMNAVIDYIKENGGNAEKLEEYKNELDSLKSELDDAAKSKDYEKMKEITNEIRNVISQFREEARNTINGNVSEVRERIRNAIEENREYINDLIKDARELRRDRNVEIFDSAVAKAERIINNLKNRGFNATEAEEKLKEIKEKRQKFIELMNNAIDACYGYGIGKCRPENVSEVKECVEFKKDIIKEFKELKELIYKAVLDYYIEKGKKAAERAEKSLEKLEKELDVSEEKAKINSIKSLINDAELNYKNKNYSKAMELLKSAHESFKEMKESIKMKKQGGKW